MHTRVQLDPRTTWSDNTGRIRLKNDDRNTVEGRTWKVVQVQALIVSASFHCCELLEITVWAFELPCSFIRQQFPRDFWWFGKTRSLTQDNNQDAETEAQPQVPIITPICAWSWTRTDEMMSCVAKKKEKNNVTGWACVSAGYGNVDIKNWLWFKFSLALRFSLAQPKYWKINGQDP